MIVDNGLGFIYISRRLVYVYRIKSNCVRGFVEGIKKGFNIVNV